MAITSAAQLGAELRRERKERHINQSELAERMGLAQKAISALEAHTGSSSVERLFQLLAALDLELVLQSRPTDASTGADW